MKFLKLIFPLLGALILSSCSSSTTPATVEGNVVFNTALGEVDGAFDNFGGLMPSVAFAPTEPTEQTRSNFTTNPWLGTEWTDLNMSHPQCSGGVSDPHCGGAQNVSPKDYMGFQIDPDAVRDNGSAINVFSRIKNSLRITCALMNLSTVDATTGYPSDGVNVVTFTDATTSLLVNTCGFAASDVPPAGMTMSFTTSTPSSTTTYDKKMVIDDGAGTTESFYFRTNATTVNLLSAEVGPTSSTRSSIQLNRTTGMVKAEFIGGATVIDADSGAEFQRVYYDPVTNEAAILSYTRNYFSSTLRNAFAMTGRPGSPSAETGLSFRCISGGAPSWSSPRRACISQATGSLVTNGPDTFTCSGLAASTVEDGSPAKAVIDDLDTNVYTGSVSGPSNGAKLTHSSVVNENYVLPFSSIAQLFTVNVSHN